MSRLVLLYQGPGANDNASKQLLDSLHKHLPAAIYAIDYISPTEIIDGDKLNTASLVAFGGGFTSGFAKALGDIGISKLKAYVLNGGAYLGFGAGGYFGCDFIEFDVGGPLEKFSERDFRLYPGIGRGPVYPGFEYGTNKGVHASLITFQGPVFSGTFHAYIDGGAAFIPSNPPKPGSVVISTTSLATFTELEGSPTAIIKTEVGTKGGKAILSGVHLEYDTLLAVELDPNLEPLLDVFAQSKQNQMEALKCVLLLLGLELC